MRTAFEHEGDIRGVDLLAALVALWREGASGSLQFSRSGATSGFDIVRGEVASSSSSDPRFETAAILVRAGKLDTRTLERLAAPEGADRALLALQAGVLTRREFRWGEKIRAVEILSDLSTWLEGEYFFFRTTEEAGDAAEPRLPIPRLILELFLRSRDRSLVLKYLGGADVPLARAPNFDAEFATFGLTADAESVVRLIDGAASAEEIASQAPAEAFAVEKLLAALVTLGLVHPAFAAGAPSSTSRPAESEPAHGREAEEPPGGEDETVDMPEGRTAREEPVDFRIAEERRAAPADEEDRQELDASVIEEPAEPPEEGEGEPGGPTELGDEHDAELGEELPARRARQSVEPDLEFAALGGEPSRPGDRDTLEPAESLEAAEPEQSDEPSEAPEVDRPLDTSTGVGILERPPQRSGFPLLGILAALLVAVGLILWLRGRGGSGGTTPPPEAAAPTPTEAVAAAVPMAVETGVPIPTATVPAAVSAAPTAVPTATRPAASPTRARPTPKPTRTKRPAGSAPPATESRPQPPPSAEQQGSRQYWLDRAAKDAQRLASDRKTHYAVQLELACEVASLADAFQHDRAGSMWLLATPYQGKTCFRVLWGRYATIEAAKKGAQGVPKFFATPKNHPAVTGVR